MWILLSLVAAISGALCVLLTEHYKQPTVPRLFWLRLMLLICVLPAAPFIDWPTSPIFYASVAALAVLVCIMDIFYFKAARDYGAGVTTRIEPLSVLLAFVLWTLITPSVLAGYMAQWHIALGIIACLLSAVWFSLQLRHCEVSRAALQLMLPAVVMIAFVTLLGKVAVDHTTSLIDGLLAFLIFQAALIVPFYGALCLIFPARFQTLRPNKSLLLSAGLMMLCTGTHIVTKNTAYLMVPNPAYVTVLGLTSPLFVLGVYKAMGRPSQESLWAGLGIVISAFILIVLTRL